MANTPRNELSHIILGVKKYPGGSFDLVGLDGHADEADLQSQFTDRVHPIPRFRYDPVSYGGKEYGLITISPDRLGPCLPTKDYGNVLRQHHLYFRRGSKNDEASSSEDWRRVLDWVKPEDDRGALVHRSDLDSAGWNSLVESTSGFTSGRKYMLVADVPGTSLCPNADILGAVDWSFVVDLDPTSDKNGLLEAARSRLESKRSVHLVVKGDRPTLNLEKGTYWYCARGLEGSAQFPAIGAWREWYQEYGNDLREQVSRIAKATTPTPITVVVVSYGDALTEHLRSVLDSFLSAYGPSVDFVMVTADPADLHVVAAVMGVEPIGMPLHHFCSGLESLFRGLDDYDPDQVALPSSSGAPILLDISTNNWIQEEIELVDLNAGLAEDRDHRTGESFLKGEEITWYELGLHYDVERDRTRTLNRMIERDLVARRSVRINLFHQPGAGGTTVARRVIWDLHGDYPAGILRRCSPRETIERLQNIVSQTDQPVVLLADGGDVSSRELDELFDYVKARHLPVVILQVVRIFGTQSPNQRTVFLEGQLTGGESNRFAYVLSREVPERTAELNGIVTTQPERFRTPFYYCLQAFGEDFLRIDTFVAARLDELTDVQKKILEFLSIAHHYGHKSVSSNAFASMLGIPANSVVDLAASLSDRGLDLVVESAKTEWRTSHDLIATEILRQLLAWNALDTSVWRQNLSGSAIEFARFCRGTSPVPGEAMLDVVRRTFVYRDNNELLGTERSGTSQFAQIVIDIPVREGRVSVLQALTGAFPDEAHFWAHLGRLYAVELKDYPKSMECIEYALALQPDDSVLHHMMGMALRAQALGMIGDRTQLSAVVQTAKEASRAFETAREKNPDDEHGYISDVQLISRVLDYAGAQHEEGLVGYLSSPAVDPYLQGGLGRSEDLLEQVRANREGQNPSTYEQDCRGRLDSLYGRHDRALQVWDNLLQRNDVYFPPIRRQIVWTYLARKERSWDALLGSEIIRANELLERNLDQEPYNDRDMRMWIQSVRHLPTTPSVEAVIEKVAYWQANSGSIESTYYLYVLNAILAIEGSLLAADSARQYLDECRSRARLRRNRTKSFEWLGPGGQLARLVHHSRLGDWDHSFDFWTNIKPLARVAGRISRIQGSQAGQIDLAGNLTAFFVPAKSGFAHGRSENQAVEFHLGFSYDGLRAWGVAAA